MLLYAYNLEQAIDKFWQVKEVRLKITLGQYKANTIMSVTLMFLLIQAPKISSNTPYS
jgi:hypothetical protein